MQLTEHGLKTPVLEAIIFDIFRSIDIPVHLDIGRFNILCYWHFYLPCQYTINSIHVKSGYYNSLFVNASHIRSHYSGL